MSNTTDNNEKPPVLVYGRVSTKNQDSRSQIVRCEEYCERHGYNVEEIFQDKYTGGGDFMNRPAMRELLEYIDKNAHKNYIVLFDDLKRFARDVRFHLKLRSHLDARNVTPKCLNYNFDDSPEGRFMETIHTANAELEREQNRRQVVQKQQARLIAGYNAFRAPIGYTKHKDPVHGTIDRPNETGEILKEALIKFSTGELQMQMDVAVFLKEKGVFGKQDAEKYLDTVRSFIENPFYAGYIEHKEREVSRRKGHHEPLISLEIFERNQVRLNKKSNTKRVRRDINPLFPLRGCVNCELCNKKITAAPSRGNGGVYYKYFCNNKQCPLRGMDIRKSANADELHKQFEAFVQEQEPTEEVVDLTLALFTEIWEDEIKNCDHYKKQQQTEKKNLEQEIDGLIEREGSPRISETLRNRYEKKIEVLDKKVTEIDVLLNKKDGASIPYRTAGEKVFGMLKSPYKIWASSDIYQKQKLFYFIFEENIQYHPVEGFRTTKMSMPIRLFREIEHCNSFDVDPTGLEPATSGMQNRRSSQMSYGPLTQKCYYESFVSKLCKLEKNALTASLCALHQISTNMIRSRQA